MESDIDVINRCINGDKNAFSILVTRYKKLVYSIVHNVLYNKDELNDVSQEVFIRVYKNLNKYNPEYKFSTWIVKITTNLCLDKNKKKKIETTVLEDYHNNIKDGKTPETECVKKEIKENIFKAIKELPDKYKLPIILFHQNNLTYEEIMKVLNEPMSIVKNRLYRGRQMLKEKLYPEKKEGLL